MRRRLRDVTKKVSGVLAGPRDQGAPDDAVVSESTAGGPDVAAAGAAGAGTAAAVVPGAVVPGAVVPSAVVPSAVGTAASDDHVRPDAAPATPELQEDPVVTAPSQAPALPAAADGGPSSSPLPSSPTQPDERCAAAVDLARSAATEVAGTAVGEHLEVEAEQDAGEGHLVTHWFATTDPAYVGWRWAVSVVRAEGADEVTVDEVVLLPGGSALLAPAWVPWSERVQPGDLGPGDLLPPAADDPRLVPAYADVDADQLPFDLHRELGLGRARVLSLEGRADAAERWYEGEAGPASPIAKAAPGQCRDCGFFAPMAGALGRLFGACANGMAPDDGRVVALTHGCGAHSETVVEQPESSYSGMAVEHEELDELELVDVRDERDPGAAVAVDAAAAPSSAPDVTADATGDADAVAVDVLADALVEADALTAPAVAEAADVAASTAADSTADAADSTADAALTSGAAQATSDAVLAVDPALPADPTAGTGGAPFDALPDEDGADADAAPSDDVTALGATAPDA